MNFFRALGVAAITALISVTPTYADTVELADSPYVFVTPEETAPIVEDYMYTTAAVNFRHAPSTDSEIITTLSRGTKVNNLAYSDNWNLVDLNGTLGYIHHNYLAPEGNMAAPANISDQEFKELVCIICAEAEDEPYAGQCAVGIVVLNRVANWEYANTIHGVIYEKIAGYTQFTPTIDGNMNSKLRRYDKGTIPQSCYDAALYALAGNKTVEYNGTTIDMSNILDFARKVKRAKFQIGHHQFR